MWNHWRAAGALLATGAATIAFAGLAHAQTTSTGFNPYGTPVNGCANPILADDAAGWGTDASGAGVSATRGQPMDHVVAEWDYNLHTGTLGSARIWMPQRTVVGGQTWDLAADVRTDNDQAQSRIEVDWYSSPTANIGHADGPWVDISGSRAYARVAGTFAAPGGAVLAHVLVRTQGLASGSGFSTTMCTYTPHAGDVPPPSSSPSEQPPPPTGQRVFTGDFDTGNFGQWPQCQTRFYNGACSGMPAGYPLTIEAGHQGQYGARFEVHDGDQPFCCGERAQLVGPSIETEGKDYWYAWDVNVDPTFPTSNSWQVLMQWHSTVDGSPPLNFLAEGDNLVLETRPRPNEPYSGITNIWTTPLAKGSWHDIQIHVHWSSSPSAGFVELWHDGTRQTFTATPAEHGNGVSCVGAIRCGFRTIYPGDAGNRSMVTYYRDAAVNGTGVVHHDGYRIATTQEALG